MDLGDLPEGVWAAYGTDYGPYLISVHSTEVEALRVAVANYGHGCFLKWGERLDDAVKRAEGR